MIAAVMAGCVAGSAGCWPFGHRGPTPQQQLYNALNRGDSAQASQIWLGMSDDDRAKWIRGEGFAMQAPSDELKKQIAQHYRQGAVSSDTPGTIVVPNPAAGGAGLQQLRALSAPQTPPVSTLPANGSE